MKALTVDLDGTAGCPRRARAAASAYLEQLAARRPAAGADARRAVLLAVSELVTNAVRHAPGPLTLVLTAPEGAVGITVSDTSPLPPRPRRGDLAGQGGGFGWTSVQRLSLRSHVVTRHDGKDVHVLLPW
ncbi:ATP-binding protein [Kitasatospora cineracea]|uniref:Anti-sigma regulatory factor (Ser/Thr protein kinase) n=1 Tax=Kitasatospora cineracea TaxID=88074 RepID=A0A3N4S699_9ACTN|nr:ATP-binding protein [Kitasatospora cineracea]RPE31904.1 anti-sigma regulatory factor (Ser/Thr protein kinase) [Kitasatospora cineracea]